MKITRTQLRKLIKEELESSLAEVDGLPVRNIPYVKPGFETSGYMSAPRALQRAINSSVQWLYGGRDDPMHDAGDDEYQGGSQVSTILFGKVSEPISVDSRSPKATWVAPPGWYVKEISYTGSPIQAPYKTLDDAWDHDRHIVYYDAYEDDSLSDAQKEQIDDEMIGAEPAAIRALFKKRFGE